MDTSHHGSNVMTTGLTVSHVEFLRNLSLEDPKLEDAAGELQLSVCCASSVMLLILGHDMHVK